MKSRDVDQKQSTYTTINWPWVTLRLSDLYLLYAEALNEVNGPNDISFQYVDKIREKAGLPGVKLSWTNFSKNHNKFQTKEWLRNIIQRERMIEIDRKSTRLNSSHVKI